MKEIINKLKVFETELLEVVDDCMSDWSYIERKYHKKFEELYSELSNKYKKEGN